VATELAGLILGRAGGNPLFVEELTHSLVENGSIHKKERQFVLARRSSEIAVPDTVQGIIAARMDRIEEDLKRTMQVASVIGREFTYRILHSITGMKDDLKTSLLNLQGLEFIYEKQLFPELEYIFKHALTQEVAYNSLLLKRRKEIHEKIAQAIEQLYSERLEEYHELLAYHYVRSDNKEKAVHYLDLANQKAARATAVSDAKAFFDEAMRILDLLPDHSENRERRISMLVNQWIVAEQLFQLVEYRELLTRYMPLASGVSKPGLEGAFYGRLAYSEFLLGSFKEASRIAAKAAPLCEGAGHYADAGQVHAVMGYACSYRGEFDSALASTRKALDNAEIQFQLPYYIRAACAAILAYTWLGRWKEAEETGVKALAVAREFSDNSQISFVAYNLSRVFDFKGDLDKAIEYGQLAVETAPTAGYRAWGNAWLGHALCRSGELEKGIKLLAVTLEVFEAGGFIPSQLHTKQCLGEGYFLAGANEKAKQIIEDVLRIANRSGARWYAGGAHRLLGELALKTESPQALPYLQEAVSISKEIKAENELALAYSGIGRYHKQQGDTEKAREYLMKALEIFERLGTLIEPEKVRKELSASA
jgi:tetratricopeptide (TPR) repeat protein